MNDHHGSSMGATDKSFQYDAARSRIQISRPHDSATNTISGITMTDSTALIIGASRGLGLGLSQEYLKRGWHVVGTTRGNGRTGLHALVEQASPRLQIERLDIVRQEQISALRNRLQGRSFDLLFVNAGIANDPQETIGEVTTEQFIQVMVTNALGPMRVIEAMQDLVSRRGTIGVMSSGLGSVADNESGGWELYRGSKAALNTFMRSFAARHADDPRALIIIAPGWVRTDMGGPLASLSVEESIPRVVDTIIAQSGKSGLRYLNYLGQPVRW
jgi:NAD(P)-dependent dehydrogenase (short-subunit alcohol dehydrogenase family)